MAWHLWRVNEKRSICRSFVSHPLGMLGGLVHMARAAESDIDEKLIFFDGRDIEKVRNAATVILFD